ncbi:MAG: SIMPL domain-containing protein [Bacteroidia bacterium]
MLLNRSKIISSSIIAIAIVAVAGILGKSWRKSHSSFQTIAITGLGQKDFKSDLIVWNATFSRSAKTLAEANRFIKEDIGQVKNFLVRKGVAENEITFTTVRINRDYKSLYNNEGNVTGNEFEGFTLVQQVVIESKNLDAVEKMAGEIGDLIEKGIEFSASEPDYYYTKLKDLKIELLKQATDDAFIRAQTIAENAKSDVGNLKNATMGVFQITGQNSNEDYSWGGSFNTKAKYKTASITVKLEFDL